MLVTLDSSLRKPLYVQIRHRILMGGLKPGEEGKAPVLGACKRRAGVTFTLARGSI